MKIIFNTDTREIKESKLSRLDKRKSDIERELDIVNMLSIAIVANANKIYKSEKAKKAFAKLVCGKAMQIMGDCTMLNELQEEMVNTKQDERL